MIDIPKMFEGLNVAIVAADADYKVIFQNEKFRKLFERVYGRSDYIGSDIREFHKAETNEKIESYFEEYTEQKRNLNYYVRDTPGGKITVVNVPFYDAGEFGGVVEFIYESSLA